MPRYGTIPVISWPDTIAILYIATVSATTLTKTRRRFTKNGIFYTTIPHSQLWQRERCWPLTNGMQCYQAPRGHQQGIVPTQASRTTPHPKPIKKLRDIIPPYQPFLTLYTHIRGLGAAKLCSNGLFHTLIPPRTNRSPFQMYDFCKRTLFVWSLLFREIGSSLRCNSFFRKHHIYT